ncbi:MAG: hypothetical protein HOI23_10485 [Deltaproteobacteria bacterium]|jgi:hypothetical protein|nr:hypothetical protein [Deltaproteobacteria bacterium]MBT6433333.1 hypothetical protein [Deltaproteobacteria bacterium]MBT6490036.1 hypothetical protein [Deltaproteobacteria bacterium]
MANNTISYNRFSALPANIAHYGTTSEELALQKGAPDPDPVLSPMADAVVPARQLALSRAGSDKLRLANPSQPMANPYEGRKPNLVHSRHAVTKLAGPVVEQLKNLVNTGAVVEGNVQHQMMHSLKRVASLTTFLDQQNKMVDTIYARTLSVSKG